MVLLITPVWFPVTGLNRWQVFRATSKSPLNSRYRKSAVRRNSLMITLSQSGETADTLAGLRLSKELGYLGSLAICNVPGSSLVRESDLALMTNAVRKSA